MMLLPKYWIRLLLFSLLGSTIPVVFLGFLSYYKASNAIQEKVNEAHLQILEETRLRVEDVLKTLDNSMIQYVNSSLVTHSMQKSLTPKDFQLVEQIWKGRHFIQSSQLYVRDVYLVNLPQNWLIHNEGLLPVTEAAEKKLLMDLLSKTNHSTWINQCPDSRSCQHGPHDVFLVKKLPLYSHRPEGFIAAKFTNTEIARLISHNQQEGTMMILDDDDRMIVQLQEDRGIDPSVYINPIRETQSEAGFFKVKLKDDEIGVTFRKSAYNGWTYLSAVSIKEITRDSREIGWITFVTCVVILGTAFMISIVGSRKMYDPIRKLYETVSGGPEGKAAGKNDEIGVIRDRVRSLMKERSRMAEQMGKQMAQLKELFLHKLFHGQIHHTEIKNNMNLFQYPASWKWHCVMTWQIDTLEGTRYAWEDKPLLMFAMNNIMNELIPANMHASPIPFGDTQVTLFGWHSDDLDLFKKELCARAKQVQDAVGHYLKLDVSAGVSRFYQDLKETPKAYKESRETLTYTVRLGRRVILFIDEVQPVKMAKPSFPFQEEKELLEAVQKPDMKRAGELLHLVIEDIFRDELNPHFYQLSLVRLLIDLVKLVQESEESFQLFHKEGTSLVDELLRLKKKEEIEDWFRRSVLEPVIRWHARRHETQVRNISEAVLQMIHHEFDTDLTLEICAARLHFHPGYLRRVFRKETGWNFSDYLSHYRLTMAKKWLRETDLKISEISERLRYSNPQNFIRYFRKMEGISPGQYRNQSE